MRQKKLLLTCVLGLLLLYGRDANAFWKYIYELSGPGPFYGMDFVFPWSLSKPTLTPPLNNDNVYRLRALGVNTTRLSTTLDGFSKNLPHQHLLREANIIPVPFPSGTMQGEDPGREEPQFVTDFLRVTVLTRASDEYQVMKAFLTDPEFAKFEASALGDRATPRERLAVAEARLTLATKVHLGLATEELRKILFRFGGGPSGFGTSLRMMPQIGVLKDGKLADQQINNRFFTLALGFAFTANNDDLYLPDFEGDKDVVWLTLYPAHEWRFAPFDGDRGNVIFNVGPAIHYFLGAQFSDFANASLRWRVGVQYGRLQAGLNFDVFAKVISLDDFGPVRDPTDLDRFSWGFFLGVDLTKH